MTNKTREKILGRLNSKEEMAKYLTSHKISTPEKLINFYVDIGGYISSSKKRVMTTVFLKTFDSFTSNDIKKARLENPVLVAHNKLSTIRRYQHKVELTKEFSTRSGNKFSESEIKKFKKLVAAGKTDMEIAEKLERTYSSVEYLHRLVKEEEKN